MPIARALLFPSLAIALAACQQPGGGNPTAPTDVAPVPTAPSTIATAPSPNPAPTPSPTPPAPTAAASVPVQTGPEVQTSQPGVSQPLASATAAPPSSSGPHSPQCRTNADCPTGQHCAQGMPLNGRCWPNGSPEPICLPPTARIATPDGAVAVRDLHEGMLVYTVDRAGNRIVAPIVRTGSTRVPKTHMMSRVALDDGRSILASPGHPTCAVQPAAPTPVGDLRAGTLVDGARVVDEARVPYQEHETFDLLPDGPTGCYWADGVLLGSTLHVREP